MGVRLVWLVTLVGLIGSACGADERAFVGQLEASVVYGSDDRIEVFNHPSATLRDIARASVVALIPTNQIERNADGLYVLFAVTLKDSKDLCDGELFSDQPTAARCSGVLIDNDLVLTAGHCMRTQRDCDDTSFVFNYHLDGPNRLAAIEDDDVYSCAEVVLREETSTSSPPTPDFAVVRLDRTVSGGHRPADVRPATETLGTGELVTMIGFGSGIPGKIDSGGEVADPRSDMLDFFVVSSDAFAGHSGSPVFDSSDRLAGHLVAGLAPDYVLVPETGCFEVNTFAESEAGEAIHYFAPIVAELCEQGLGGDNLCEETACQGQPCGVDSPGVDNPTPGVAAPATTGCTAARGSAGPAIWALFVMIALALRFRRRVV
ncbi:MAG: serine protease [Myxococcota bacterium]